MPQGVLTHYSFDPASLRLSHVLTTGAAGQDYGYLWDRVGNLKQRTKPGTQEVFNYDPLNRLDTVTLNGGNTPTLDVDYDPNGNITRKQAPGGSDVGTYSYGTNGGGPHAVSAISGNRGGVFHYDGAGNLTCNAWNAGSNQCNPGSTTAWYSYNLPKRIELGSTTTYADFSYGPNREKVRTTEHEGTATRIVFHVGPHFEVEINGTGTWYRSTVFFGERMVYAKLDKETATYTPSEDGYLHQDYQGSLDRVTAIAGVTGVTALSFDAFGKRRNTDWSNDNTDVRFADNQWLERGYTGHQQLDGVRLIHMNGRVQNPIWGRMLSPDPLVGDLSLPQSLNPYSYVYNNPMSYVDPTGLDAEPNCPAWAACIYHPSREFLDQFTDYFNLSNQFKRYDAIGERFRNRYDVPASSFVGAARAIVDVGLSPAGFKIRDPLCFDYGACLAALKNGLPITGPERPGTVFDVVSAVLALSGIGAAGPIELEAVAAARAGVAAENGFFQGSRYTQKVLEQMKNGADKFHSFPESVGAFERAGTVRTITGGDGVVRQMLEIPGSYGGRNGVFQFIKEADGTINHRLFVPGP